MTTPDDFPAQATIDDWIRWLEDRRRQQPDAQLKSLLPSRPISDALIVELSCVDLILCHRADNAVPSEEYVNQFPGQFSDEQLLDLIDAELCVLRERKRPCDLKRLTQRFPHLASSIIELAELDAPVDLDLVCDPQAESPSASASFELSLHRDLTLVAGKQAVLGSREPGHKSSRDDSIDVPIPITPPKWMSSAKCIATRMTSLGRCWVVKGRDVQRNEIVLMKVLPLSPKMGASQHKRILDLCETTNAVAHPSWVAPRIAAIHQGHLAVVRPWIFGTPLAQYQSTNAPSLDQLTPLVQLGITLSAAHRMGATHGLVSANNVIVNHQADLQLVDAASSADGWGNCLMHWSDDLQERLPWRIENDVRSYQLMLIETCLRFLPRDLRNSGSKFIQLVSDVPDPTDPETCISIAENLQRAIDQPGTSRRWWRRSQG